MTVAPFTEIDRKAINTIRVLAADTVQKANSGHPGAPMGCAPMAHVLFSRFIRGNPKNSHWYNRDRFVLSNGHGCALQYVMLHLMGYKLSMDDLKAFRQFGSLTPGHPEVHHTDGIEVTTGPLGQGISNAVGLAAAERHMGAVFNKPDFPIVDNKVFCIAGDGCLQEGVASEAASLAGHLELGNLIVLYDDNKIQIDGSTELAFTEDVNKRFESYGWHTDVVADGDNDFEGLAKAIEAAVAIKNKPSLIRVRTTIGFGSKLQGTEKVHGSPLAAADLAEAKKKFGFDPEKFFSVDQDVYEFYAKIAETGAAAEKGWNALLDKYTQTFPAEGAEFKRRLKGELPKDWKNALPKYDPSGPALGTRKTSENVINAIALVLPEFIGGSADLTHSNYTIWKGAKEFQPNGSKLGDYSGRYFRFGVREHGMAAICNGIAAYGGIIPFGATFLNFIMYAAGAVRLSALSKLQVLYIMTHDSIGLGEDGPTHQPVEAIPYCRATPNLLTFRPADGNETAGAYVAALENTHGPSVFALSRQNLPQLAGSSIEKVAHGAYIVTEDKDAQVVLVGTGSEVSLMLDTAKLLATEGVKSRVVSAPCLELFERQPLEYQNSVLGGGIPVVSAEAAHTFGWQKWAHASYGVETFGASAPAPAVYKHFGLVPEVMCERVKKVLNFYAKHPVPELLGKTFY
ncbi:Transketolase [Gonapodya sp. JEL0774]|nr:Transketolase [Gonapodya sp. JEL0774]